MMLLLAHLLKGCLTHADNETYDHARVLAALSVLVALGCTIYTVWRNGTFDIQTFGVGMGSLFAGVGAHLKLRGDN